MKKGWQIKRLGDVCEKITDGTHQTPTYFDEGILFLSSRNVTSGTIDWEDVKYIDSKQHVEMQRRVSPRLNDILLAKNGTTGVAAMVDRDVSFDIYVSLALLRPLAVVRPTFLLHFINSPLAKQQFSKRLKGIGVPNLHLEEIREVTIPVPPLSEQQRIVSILDDALEKITTAKANAEKNLQNARALFESHLDDVFTKRGKGWVEKKLGDLCDFLNGFAFKSGDAVAESRTQLVRMGNLHGNQLDLSRSPVYYPNNFATDHSRYVLDEGDIIMSLTGTTGKEDYGFAVRIPDCDNTLLMNQRILKFDALRRDLIDECYFLHYLRSRCFLDALYPTANGTRQANLSSVTMKLLPVPLCSLKEQKMIAAKLDSLSSETQRLEAIYRQKLAALEALKKSLLDQAFSGGL